MTRNCRMELCRYWPGEGCMAGVMPCHADAPCPECGGTGAVEARGCNCGVGPSGYYGTHESGCGLEPCPRGCPYVPYADRLAKAAGEGSAP
jgi:hypothetical protein